jgi:hypothetical protein
MASLLLSTARTAALPAALLCAAALISPLPLRAEQAPAPQSGEVEVSSLISPVDACNRAQGQRPAGAVVTTMHYERLGEPAERSFRCRVRWSTAKDAVPTGRPILFGPTL